MFGPLIDGRPRPPLVRHQQGPQARQADATTTESTAHGPPPASHGPTLIDKASTTASASTASHRRQPLARPTRPASRQGPKQGPHGPQGPATDTNTTDGPNGPPRARKTARNGRQPPTAHQHTSKDGRTASDRHGGHQHGRTDTAHDPTRHGAMTPPAHRHTAAHTGGQRHGPRATARRNDTDTSDTSKDGQRHGHRDRRRRTQGTQGPAPHTSGDGPQAAAECYPLTRQAHKAQKRAATGHTRTTADQWTSGRPKGRQRPRKRPRWARFAPRPARPPQGGPADHQPQPQTRGRRREPCQYSRRKRTTPNKGRTNPEREEASRRSARSERLERLRA